MGTLICQWIESFSGRTTYVINDEYRRGLGGHPSIVAVEMVVAEKNHLVYGRLHRRRMYKLTLAESAMHRIGSGRLKWEQ